MARRFWIAVTVGVALGGAAVAGFQPYVASKVEDKAARYGAQVEIQRITPTFDGVRLRGVSVTIPDVPGVRVSAKEVMVSWGDHRPRSTTGGRIEARGSAEVLYRHVEAWRKKHLSGGSGQGSARRLAIDGFVVSWKESETSPRRVAAAGVSLVRQGGSLRISAETLEGGFDGGSMVAIRGDAELVKTDGRYQLAALRTASVDLELKSGGLPKQLDASDADGAGTSAPAVKPAGSAPAPAAKPAGAKPHPRVLKARKAHALARMVARGLDERLAPGAQVQVAGARAQLHLGDGVLNLGPGTLGIERADAHLVVALAPDLVEERAKAVRSLTFRVQVPLRDDAAPVVAELRGGPIGLGMLGVRDGDLGLRDTTTTTIESDARFVLPASGESVRIEGSGKLHKLALEDKRLAPSPVKDVELAWRAKATASLDGSRIQIDESEFNLGEARLLLKGNYQHEGDAHRFDLKFEVPLVTCQEIFTSIPKAMVPQLVGMRFAGSLTANGHLRFDTAKLAKSFDVDWDGALSCRVLEAPQPIDVKRFRSPFEKVVYTPTGDERVQQFGPDTEHWAALESVTHFMQGAVLTTEDFRFFRHAGFDQEAVINSIRENIEKGRFARGASTISMQLAKNLYLKRTKTISRKLQEAILTIYLEQELTKKEIMELYFNVIEYGPMVYGIQPAARHYFNTSPGQLSLGQALYLAMILRNPKEQFFGAGGAVIPSRTTYLRRLMKTAHKIGRVSDEELEVGLRETVVFGAPVPQMAPPAPEDVYPDEAIPEEAIPGEAIPEEKLL